ncbi:leucine-rich repeat domain-containing protein [Mucilaginibacter sp. CAU 1740]|uniref:leucine-rich repeat domain-containing protein n=1 Tax=Mucilaginibacter sp. CAU 1740 TaxID=3140365 RepID=UPI00325C1F86
MKRTCLTLLLSLLLFNTIRAQDKSFRPTYNYDGYIQPPSKPKLPVKLNFLVLLDSSVVGAYYYHPQSGQLKLSGIFNKDYTISLFEWNDKDQNTGRFDGRVSKDRRLLTGLWTSADKKHRFPFSFSLVTGMKSYWDYIKKKEKLKEYRDINIALKEPEKVQHLDLGDRHYSHLPESFIRFENMTSLNLLGNDFKIFPAIVSKLPQLEELSFASTGMKYIGPEIGKLKNLRILILDFNTFDRVPAEIGELTNLMYLDVSMNKNLKSLPPSIANLKQLQELQIGSTGISPQEVKRIKSWLPHCVVVTN